MLAPLQAVDVALACREIRVSGTGLARERFRLESPYRQARPARGPPVSTVCSATSDVNLAQ